MDFDKWLNTDEDDVNLCRWYLTFCTWAPTKIFAIEAIKIAYESGKKEGFQEAKRLVTEYIMR